MPVINTNIASLIAQNNLSNNQTALTTAIQRLSSGLRINSAKDDAAGMAIANGMTTQINGLDQAVLNANDAISLSQTADSALSEMTDNLQRIRTLAVEAANSTNSASDRASLDQEVQQRLAEINRLASQTTFNGLHVLDGTFGNASFQVGADVGQTINVNLGQSLQTNAIGGYVNQGSNYAATVTPTKTTDPATTGTYVATTAPYSYTGVTTGASNDLAASSLELNGTTIQSSSGYTGTAPGQTADSAYAKAAAINASDVNGLNATASTTATLGTAAGGTAGTSDFLDFTAGVGVAATTTSPAVPSTYTYTLSINGTAVINQTNSTSDMSIDQAVTDINAMSATTGVTAANSSSGLVLTAADGRNIQLEENFSSTANDTGGAVVSTVFGQDTTGTAAATSDQTFTYGGQITLQSSAPITVTSSSNTVLNSIGLASGTTVLNVGGSLAAQNGGTSGQSVQTVNSANQLILAVDSALTTVNNLDSTFGAIENRFQSVISSNQAAQQNLTQARSSIQDVDFAAETAALSKAQVLQQAGMAMVAQANALPQGVLTLLR